MTQTDEHHASAHAQRAHQHRSMWRLTLVGVLVAAVGALAGVGTLFGLGGMGSSGEAGSPNAKPSGVPGATAPISTASAATKPFDYLSALVPQAGTSNLTALPRDLRENPAYARAIAIQCPSNNSGDKVREITYPLRGRYVELAGTVAPRFTTEPDSHAHVFAVAAHREADGTLTRRPVGQQLGATGTASAPITADTEGAVELTLQVKCEHPEGIVIISDGRLIRAT